MSAIFFGSPEFAVPTLLALLEAGIEVGAVVTQPDKRRSRGGAPVPCAVKAEAIKRGLRVLDPRSVRDAAFIAEIASYRPEFLVVVAYGKVLPPELLKVPSIAPVNLHSSLLPKYRGAAPMAWAIIDGNTETGLTTMLMSEGLDEGDILLEERHPIHSDDTTETLSARLSEAGGPLVLKTLAGLKDGSIKPRPQSGEASYARMLTKDDGHIDWTMDALRICNLVRGLDPWPGAYTFMNNERIRIIKAEMSAVRSEPGRIEHAGSEGIIVGAAAGSVIIKTLQPEGKRPMPASAFIAGRNLKPGLVLR